MHAEACLVQGQASFLSTVAEVKDWKQDPRPLKVHAFVGAFLSVILQVEEPTSVCVGPGCGCAVSLSLPEGTYPRARLLPSQLRWNIAAMSMIPRSPDV